MEPEYLITSTDAQLARHYRARAGLRQTQPETPRIQPPALPTPTARPRSVPRPVSDPLKPLLSRVPEPLGPVEPGVTVLARSPAVVGP